MIFLKSLIAVVALCFISVTSFGQDVRAEISIAQEKKLLKEGDLVEGVLKVWPLESAELNEFKNLIGNTFFNALYLLEVQSLNYSVNNADVVELKGLFVVRKSGQNSLTSINYKGKIIPIEPIIYKIEAINKLPKDFYILNQTLENSYLVKVGVSLFILFVVIFILIKRNKFKGILQKFKNDPVILECKKYNALFLKANSREDFEQIYATRNSWMQLIKTPAPAYQEFFIILNQYQYKKTWEEEDFLEVKSSFEIIRGSFK